jgi:hypothetical protein
MSPLMEGAVGFRFMCLHFVSVGMSVLLQLITFLTCDCKDFVGSVLDV